MKLFIDSATKILHVALMNEKLIDIHSHVGNNDHSKTLMVEIEKMMLKNKVDVKDLTEIIVGEGPGSYTGVRIAVVVAKTLAHFLSIPLTKVSSLKVMASSRNGIVPVMIDARRGNVFCAIYDTDNNYKIIIEPKMRKTEEFMELIDSEVVTIDNLNINPLDLETEVVENLHTFTPNYLREWGE